MSAASDFISKVTMHFPVRFDSPEREREWLRQILEVVAGYEPDVLDRAAKKIVDTRVDRRFPLPAEIRKICLDFQAEAKAARLPLPEFRHEGEPRFNAERLAMSDLAICTQQGRRAANEDWILGLWFFFVDHGRAPTAGEERTIQRAAVEAEEAYRQCLMGQAGELSKVLAKLGDSRKARGEEKRALVLANTAP